MWEYDPPGERLPMVFQSPGRNVLDMPDNLFTVTGPWADGPL